MKERRLVIAGTGSGVGKTSMTIGLMAAFMQKGFIVQGFKCGPDTIDPTYHTAVTKRISRNLDSWILTEEQLRTVFAKGSEGADISIIEGVMGFYDGKDPLSNKGSTAEISQLTESPVLLVVNCASMARSAAAVVRGFQQFTEANNIVAVLANQVGSESHFQIVKTAIEQECQIPVIGYMKREQGIEMPERELGLVPAIERGELDSFFEQLGQLILKTVDVDRLFTLAETTPFEHPHKPLFTPTSVTKPIRIAIAKDAAFNAYYEENLEALRVKGAELIPFSPLLDDCLPQQVDGLYMCSHLPEEFMEPLASNDSLKQSIKNAIQKGLPTIAEGGAFLYLTEAVETNQGMCKMVGVIPCRGKLHPKLQAIGYREVQGSGENKFLKEQEQAKGHEYHYFSYQAPENFPYAYKTSGMFGTKQEGFATGNILAGLTRLHFTSCEGMVDRWLQQCQQF